MASTPRIVAVRALGHSMRSRPATACITVCKRLERWKRFAFRARHNRCTLGRHHWDVAATANTLTPERCKIGVSVPAPAHALPIIKTNPTTAAKRAIRASRHRTSRRTRRRRECRSSPTNAHTNTGRQQEKTTSRPFALYPQCSAPSRRRRGLRCSQNRLEPQSGGVQGYRELRDDRGVAVNASEENPKNGRMICHHTITAIP